MGRSDGHQRWRCSFFNQPPAAARSPIEPPVAARPPPQAGGEGIARKLGGATPGRPVIRPPVGGSARPPAWRSDRDGHVSRTSSMGCGPCAAIGDQVFRPGTRQCWRVKAAQQATPLPLMRKRCDPHGSGERISFDDVGPPPLAGVVAKRPGAFRRRRGLPVVAPQSDSPGLKTRPPGGGTWDPSTMLYPSKGYLSRAPVLR
ncbi:MAG: hypothetical protein GEEBNDBF_02226 [bacterium]|nr:hypothetical protein [bacterium]